VAVLKQQSYTRPRAEVRLGENLSDQEVNWKFAVSPILRMHAHNRRSRKTGLSAAGQPRKSSPGRKSLRAPIWRRILGALGFTGEREKTGERVRDVEVVKNR